MMSLLLLTALLSAADPDERSIAAIRALNGTASVDKALHDESPLAVKLDIATDTTFAKLCKHPQVGSLEVQDAGKVTEKGFESLRELPRMQKLLLFKSNIGDKALAEISRMKSLEVLYLGESKITDIGMASLANLTELKVLDLYDTKVGDRGIAALGKLAKLDDLNLSGTKVTDSGITLLKECKKLQTLKVTRTAVTQKGISELETALPKVIVRK